MNWRRFFQRGQVDAEQRQELESYLEITTEEYIARGMNRAEACAAARKKLGNATLVREEVYRMNTVAIFDSIWCDIRHALRSLRREPAFNLTATLTLALGIGATTVIFSIVNSVLLKPLGYPGADRLVALTHAAAGSQTALVSAPFLHFTYIHESRTFESSGLWQNVKVTVTGLAEPEEVSSLRVTSQVLPLLRVTPLIGRVFSDKDDSPGSPATTILAYGYWQRRFGGDSSAVGRALTIDGQLHTIIGVMPSTFRFLDQKVDLIRPLQLNPTNTFLGYFAYRGIARLKPGVTLAQANADANRMIPLAIETFPPFRGGSREAFRANAYRADLHLLKESVVGDVGNTLWVLMGTIGLVLLIACVNCTNLFLVRTDVRHREFAVRAALGAGRFQIAGQLLTESVVLGLGACIVGVALAYGSLRLLVTLAPANLPRVEEIGIDGVILVFALGVSFLCAVLVGLLPVLQSIGSSPASELHGGRTTNLTAGSHRLRSSLVVAQVAIALVLLIASGLMIRTFRALGQVSPGFISENVQTFRLTVPQIQVPQAENTARMMQGIMDRVAAIPGVTNVAAASTVPLSGDWMTEDVRAENVDYSPGQPAPSRRVKFVSPGFFSALGTRVVAGRDFSWTDNYDLRQVAIVSEKLAREEWRTPEAALGKHIQLTRNGSWKEVIAVVADVHDDALSQPSPPIAYFPILMDRYYVPGFVARTVTLVARTPRAGTESLLPEIQKAVWSVNPNLALAEVRTMGNLFDASMARTSFALVMLAISGAMALALGMVGIYGLLAYTVEQRRCEVGIRMALGAQPATVRSMFVRRGLALSAIGIAVGLGSAAGLSRVMSSLLFGVEPLDPMTYAATAVSLMAAAVAASYIPALRAAAIDPIETLRGE